jgi:hypothetical protein
VRRVAPGRWFTTKCGATGTSSPSRTGAGGQLFDEAVGHLGEVAGEGRSWRPEAWLVFACEAHVSGLVAARELLDRDRGVLAEWRAESALAEVGQPWRRPEPLARGGDAVDLVERARRWAERHPDTGAP